MASGSSPACITFTLRRLFAKVIDSLEFIFVFVDDDSFNNIKDGS